MTDQQTKPGANSAASLLGDVVAGFGRLIQGEFALARAEAKRSLGDAKSAIGKLIIAAVLGITALNMLAGAAVAGLISVGWTPPTASLAVGVVALLLAVLLARMALAQLKPSNLAPKRTLANLRQDAQTLKSTVISDATSQTNR